MVCQSWWVLTYSHRTEGQSWPSLGTGRDSDSNSNILSGGSCFSESVPMVAPGSHLLYFPVRESVFGNSRRGCGWLNSGQLLIPTRCLGQETWADVRGYKFLWRTQPRAGKQEGCHPKRSGTDLGVTWASSLKNGVNCKKSPYRSWATWGCASSPGLSAGKRRTLESQSVQAERAIALVSRTAALWHS